MLALVVSKGAGALPGEHTMREGDFTVATVLRSKIVDWSAADYKSIYADFYDARQFCAMFSNGRNAIIYDRRGVNQNTDVWGWNSRWQVLHSY